VSFVECQDVAHAMALGENHDRRIGKTDPEIRIALDEACSIGKPPGP
jgi:hypothetical protein